MTHPKLFSVASIASAALLTLCIGAHAQTAPAPAATASPAKKELVAKIIEAQKPGIEALARNLVEQPAAQVMQGAGVALRTRVAADKREALATAIQADIKKYVEEAVPVARERALRLAPSTIGAVLEEKLTEDELRQVLAIMQSAAFAKFQGLQGEMQNALTAKLVAETRPLIEPKIKALDQTVGKRLGLDAPTPAASGARRPASN